MKELVERFNWNTKNIKEINNMIEKLEEENDMDQDEINDYIKELQLMKEQIEADTEDNTDEYYELKMLGEI